MKNIFNYIERESPIHELTGATKLICLVLFSVGGMITFDTRYVACLAIIALLLFRISKIRLSEVSILLKFTLFFMVFNNLVLFVFSPQYGVEIYGTKHVLFGSGRFTVTAEQLFYHLNQMLKCLAMVPIVLLFVCTTNPSEFASSLNKVGVPYSVSYSVALALRYIPDIQLEYHDISRAQQARGIEMSKKENLIKRLKAAAEILIPLILSSMDRIETVSNAMELRGFGKNKKRTWYTANRFRAADIAAIVFCILLVAGAVAHNTLNGGRFWNPFTAG